jgi:hypothetical protein
MKTKTKKSVIKSKDVLAGIRKDMPPPSKVIPSKKDKAQKRNLWKKELDRE